MAPPTVTVTQVATRITQRVAADMATPMWVRGEVSSHRQVRSGMMFLDLVDTDPHGRTTARLTVTCKAQTAREITRKLDRAGVALGDGIHVRVLGRLEFYGPSGTLQLALADIDPTFTAGQMAMQRAATLQQLTDLGHLGRNATVPVPRLPLRVGLVTSPGSDAHHDVVRPLEASPWAFTVTVHPATMQGPAAPASVAAAVAQAGSQDDVDLIAICRGGGAASTLTTFDDPAVCTAVATSRLPVWVGIGHRADHPLVEQVAHTAWATPTAVAGGLVDTVRAVAADTAALKQRIHQAADLAMGQAVARGRAAATTIGRVDGQLATAVADLQSRHDRACTAAARQLDRHHATATHAAEAATAATGRQLDRAAAQLDRWAATVAAADPTARLAAGWALLVDRDRNPLGHRMPDTGEQLSVTTAAGTFTVTVTPNQ